MAFSRFLARFFAISLVHPSWIFYAQQISYYPIVRMNFIRAIVQIRGWLFMCIRRAALPECVPYQTLEGRVPRHQSLIRSAIHHVINVLGNEE